MIETVFTFLKVGRMLRTLGAGLVSCGVFALAAFAAYPAGKPFSRFLTGQNYWYYPPDSGYPIIMDSGVTLLRIGGIAFDDVPLTDAALLKQVDNIRSIGAEPLIQVSRHKSAATAAATVHYLNVVNGRAVKYWSIGNEPDLTWTGTESDLAVMTAGYIRAIAPAMRDVDPTIHISAPEMAWYSTTKFESLLGGAADITGKDGKGRYYVDCITFHRYPFADTLSRSAVLSEMHTEFESKVAALVNRIAYANTLHGRSGAAALTWGLTEFNMTYKNPSTATNHPAGLGVSSYLNGQFFAEYYRVGMKHGAQIMAPWSLLEGGGAGAAGDLGYLGGTWAQPVRRSSFYHLQMVADYLIPGGYLASTSNAANLAVLATSSPAQDWLSVMLLNEETSGSQAFTLRLDDGTVQGGGTKINVSAGLAKEYAGTLENQSTVVFMFDAAGVLQRRVTYSLARYLLNQAPLVETFSGAPALTAQAGDARVDLSWTAVAGATGYVLQRATVTGGPYATIAPALATASYADTGLTNGTTYFYVVSATTATGENITSVEVSVSPRSATPPPPPAPTPPPSSGGGGGGAVSGWFCGALALLVLARRGFAKIVAA